MVFYFTAAKDVPGCFEGLSVEGCKREDHFLMPNARGHVELCRPDAKTPVGSPARRSGSESPKNDHTHRVERETGSLSYLLLAKPAVAAKKKGHVSRT